MFLSLASILLAAAPALSAPTTPYRYYLKSSTDLFLSSSMTFNGNTNYVLLTDKTLAQPLTLHASDGSITLDTSNVIGASSEAPVLLSNDKGLNDNYKLVVLGDQQSEDYTKGFSIDDDSGALSLDKEGFGGFVACTAAKGVKQVYWYSEGEGSGSLPVICDEVSFQRQWNLTATGSG
ncbi:hypothetical protein ASPSYDRAFT_140972 [Aspergillus sydowii CBS 593.65]|uniref:DUF7907 domain-containing protein n=1 Tax=Aspergillus sydowii CBS 593.65 TaxID=1036612 RepID=A0A1L9TZV2_9EURO|nr:uncharacterized protein ASPSYDRAFT_140972 [Aspergillus sydowii CBS 593.65]OJJ64977.1 hypothetical protein ASPSYDRAFT_140972 [Aspergillus sydowii CBS 593.65]